MKTVLRAGMLVLGCGLCLATATLVAQPLLVDSLKVPKRTAEEWRKLYPFLSLANRLAYENKSTDKSPPPVLTPEAVKALDAAERSYQSPFGNVRRESLKKLHSNEVESFIKREGFGIERMPSPSPRSLPLPQAPTFALGRVGYPESLLEKDPAVTLPEKGQGVVGADQVPSRESLSQLHSLSGYSFLMPSSLGYAKQKQEVAGFDPHGFRFEPYLGNVKLLSHDPKQDVGPGKKRWVLRKLELVSLTKAEKPLVYVSAQLPRMEDLKGAPKRDLDAFEAVALKRLERGEDVASEETLNRIRMVGAVRANAACLECHTAQRGQLLGAFTYELLRDPPAKK